MSPAAERLHVPALSRLCPREVTVPAQFPPEGLLAMMVLISVTELPALLIPPPLLALLLLMVVLVSVTVPVF